MSAILTTSYVSNDSRSFSQFNSTKSPFSFKLDRLYREVFKAAETQPNQYSDFSTNKKTRRTHPTNISLGYSSTINQEIGKTKLSYLTGKLLPLNKLNGTKDVKPLSNHKDRNLKYVDSIKSNADTMRELKRSLRKSNDIVFSSKIFKSPQKNNKLQCELKGNNNLITKMKKNFPEYLPSQCSFISSDLQSTQRIGRIKYQLNKI